MQQPSPSAETEALLARLAARPGVQSTLILSRSTGAIVRSSGLVTAEELAAEDTATPSNTTYTNGTTNGEGEAPTAKKGTRNAEEVARLVWTFVQSVGELVEGLNGEYDEAKLVRIRTKRNEVVVVPDKAFLAVVVHDTAPA